MEEPTGALRDSRKSAEVLHTVGQLATSPGLDLVLGIQGPSRFQLGQVGEAGRLCATDQSSWSLDSPGPTNLGTGTGDLEGGTSCCPAQSGCAPFALMQLLKGSEPTHDHDVAPKPAWEHQLSLCRCRQSPFSLSFLLLLSCPSANSL